MLCVFAVVIGALAALVATYEPPTTDELRTFAEQTLFPELEPERIKRIEIHSPGAGEGGIVLERVGARKWRMTRPVDVLASATAVREVLEQLAALTAARGYKTRRFEEYELAKPLLRMTVASEDGETLTIAFGTRVAEVAGDAGPEYVDRYTLEQRGGSEETVPQRYARVGGRAEVLIAPDTLCPLIDRAPSAFRERQLLFSETVDEVVPLAASAVTGVTVAVREADDVRTIEFAKRDGRWVIAAPVKARANHALINGVLKHMLALRAEGPTAFAADAPSDLAAFGLDEPGVTVEFTSPNRSLPRVVRFGTAPPESKEVLYAQSTSRAAVLVVRAAAVAKALRSSVEFFRNRRVADVSLADLQSVSFAYTGGRPGLTIARRTDDPSRWRLLGAMTGRAGAPAVPLVRQVVTLTVAQGGFVAEAPGDLKPYGLDSPQIVITVTEKGRPPAEILIGGSPPDRADVVYAKNAAEPSVVLVPSQAVEDFTADPAALRSAELFEGFDRWSAFELEVTAGGRTTKLVRQGRLQWKAASPEGLRLDFAAPSNFLAQVAALKIRAWTADKPQDLARFGLDKPRAVLRIKTTLNAAAAPQDAKTFMLHLGARTGDGSRCYARLPSESNVYEIDADVLTKAERGPLLFRQKKVLSFEPRAVKSLRLEGGRADYAAQKAPGGRWLLTRPLLAPADFASVRELIAMLNGLSAVELIAEDDAASPKYGLVQPAHLIALIIKAAPPAPADAKGAKPETVLVSKTLVVGEPAPGKERGGRYAAVREDGIVFVMGAEDIKRLEAELLTRSVVNVLKSEITDVRIVHRDGAQVAVEREGAGWEVTSHRDVKPDVLAIDRLVREAGLVVTDGYVRYDQKGLEHYGLAKPRLTVTIGRRGKAATGFRIGDEASERPGLRSRRAPRDQKYYYATCGGIPAVFLVPEAKVKALGKHVEDLIRSEKE